MKKLLLICAVLLMLVTPLMAQDESGESGGEFGGFEEFGGFDEPGAGGGGFLGMSLNLRGQVSANLLFFVNALDDLGLETILSDMFSGNIELSVGGKYGKGLVRLKGDFSQNSSLFSVRVARLVAAGMPLEQASMAVSDDITRLNFLDEAYIAGYFGPWGDAVPVSLELEGGVRKLAWGRADAMGPLDVVNPLDYSDLTDMLDADSRKIARPMVHTTVRIGEGTKIEGVFVPAFEGIRYATEGPWTPLQMRSAYQEASLTEMTTGLVQNTGSILYVTDPTNTTTKIPPLQQKAEQLLQGDLFGVLMLAAQNPDTSALKYFQSGGRVSTSFGPVDLGAQYYYGRLHKPASNVSEFMTTLGTRLAMSTSEEAVTAALAGDYPDLVVYNPYHQIGIDYAQAIDIPAINWAFTLRGEAAINLTEDTDGTDPGVYNPSVGWFAAIETTPGWGVTLNLQAIGSVRLFHDKIDKSETSMDTEKDTKITSTKLIATVLKSFFQETLDCQVAAIWGIEDGDFLILPSVTYKWGDFAIALSGGIFGGDEKGELGQYRDNSFVKLLLSYNF